MFFLLSALCAIGLCFKFRPYDVHNGLWFFGLLIGALMFSFVDGVQKGRDL